jgi:hypothetical protein
VTTPAPPIAPQMMPAREPRDATWIKSSAVPIVMPETAANEHPIWTLMTAPILMLDGAIFLYVLQNSSASAT